LTKGSGLGRSHTSAAQPIVKVLSDQPRLTVSAGFIAQAALRSNGQDLDVYFGPSVALKYTFGKPKGHPLPPDPDID
jgi:hypothetical protein